MSLNNFPKLIKPSVINETVDVFDLTGEELAPWKNKIALLCQGQAVQILEGPQTGTLALIFAIAYDLADELSIKMNHGEKYLIFNRSLNSVIRENEIDLSLFKLIEKNKTENHQKSKIEKVADQKIDLSVGWPMGKQINLAKTINIFIDSIIKDFQPTESLVLTGDVPAPALLAVLEIFRPMAKNISYLGTNKELILFPQN